MAETLKLKRAKPSMELTYAYVCTHCRWIQEAPETLECCGLPMISLSRLYQFAGKTSVEAMKMEEEHEKQTPAGGDADGRYKETNHENLALYLTARE